MMRLGVAEYVLTRISEDDRKVIKDLALSRGCLTIKQYAQGTSLSAVGARLKLKKSPLDKIFKSIRLNASAKATEFFLLRSRYARIYTNNPKEPRSIKTILDALLRSRIHCDGGVWQHNLRHAAIMVVNDCTHIADCLDRSESSVLKLTTEINVTHKILHTLSASRFVAFQRLMSRMEKVEELPVEKAKDITWDDVWKQKTLNPPKNPTNKYLPIELKFHDVGIVRNLQV